MEMESYVALSDLAKKLRINKSQLLYYEQLGLITPAYTVGNKNMRIYNLEDTVGRVRFIEKEKKKNSLTEVKKLLEKRHADNRRED